LGVEKIDEIAGIDEFLISNSQNNKIGLYISIFET
jgi:hypothetical protein